MFVCSHCGEITTTLSMKRAANAKAWAIGQQRRNGFHVRRVVWGLLMAQAEKRMDEEIRACVLLVESEHRKRNNPLMLPLSESEENTPLPRDDTL